MPMNALVLLALMATQAPDEAAVPPTPGEIAARSYSDNLMKQMRASASPRERAFYDDHFIDTWLAFRKAIAARPMPASMVANALHGANMGIRDPIGEANSIMAMAYAAAVPQAVQALTHACRPQSHP